MAMRHAGLALLHVEEYHGQDVAIRFRISRRPDQNELDLTDLL